MKRYIKSTKNHVDGKYSVYDTGNGYQVYLDGECVSPEFNTEEEAHEWIITNASTTII